MPLLSSALPACTGSYGVGTIDIEVPCERRRFGDHVFRKTKEPAFELETVLFALYYPTRPQSAPQRKKHKWLPAPISLHGEGYARFAHINNAVTNRLFTFGLWGLAGSTTVPAKVDVPIHDSEKEEAFAGDNEASFEFPIVIFSHGVAGHRAAYTQYCSELASRGYVVASIEHRDGSGPGTIIMGGDGSKTTRYHFDNTSLEPKPDMAAFKMMQLAMREAEVEETVRVLRLINDGIGEEIHLANARGEGSALEACKGRLNLQHVIMAGHSFGATLALQAVKGGPVYERPFVGCLAFDPGKHSGPLNDDVRVPLVVVHSNSWSAKFTIFQGRPHFEVVKDLVQRVTHEEKKSAWFLTARGTTHPSITDAPLIEPFLCSWTTGATINVHEGLMQYVRVTAEFLAFLDTGERRGILKEDVTHPAYDRDARHVDRKRRMSDDFAKYWQIHVAPRAAGREMGYDSLDSVVSTSTYASCATTKSAASSGAA